MVAASKADEVTPSAVVQAYRDNPAAADAAYKGRVLRIQTPVRFDRVGNETVAVFDVPDRQVSRIVFHFVSESEPASMVRPNTVYTIDGTCDGVRGGGVEFVRCRVAGELALAPPGSLKDRKDDKGYKDDKIRK